jgi:drug/metabolite transporter (DMT)-like permease
MIAATLFAAIYSVGSKRVTDRYPADVVTALIALAGAAMLLPLALREGLTLAMPPLAWGGLLVLGAGAGALANLWWLHLLSFMDASRAGMILFLIPVFSTVLAVAFLHEPVTIVALAGGALVLAGVAIMQRKA